jgi:hypothetical protein
MLVATKEETPITSTVMLELPKAAPFIVETSISGVERKELAKRVLV